MTDWSIYGGSPERLFEMMNAKRKAANMNYSVWKFPVPIESTFLIDMPKGARVLDCNLQYNPRTDEKEPMIWALVDKDAPKVKRYFRLAATGEDLPAHSRYHEYVGAFLINQAQLVFHLFDLGEEGRQPNASGDVKG